MHKYGRWRQIVKGLFDKRGEELQILVTGSAREVELRFFRDIDRREVDFVLMEDDSPIHFIECKSSQKGASRSLKYLKKRFPNVNATQVTMEGKSDLIDKNGARICPAHIFLNEFV